MESCKLFLLGKMDPAAGGTLTIMIEWNRLRAVERVTLDASKLGSINKQVRKLQACAVGGGIDFDKNELVQLGSQLFQTVMVDSIKEVFDQATAGGMPRPLEIFCEDPVINTWPWEYLYHELGYICREQSPVSRGLLSHRPCPVKPKATGLRVLVCLGKRENDLQLSVAEELKWIQNRFQPLIDNGQAVIQAKRARTCLGLNDMLMEQNEIVHFIGHAGFDTDKNEGYLCLEDDAGKIDKMYASKIAAAINTNEPCQLVFLNGCETASAAPDDFPARSSIAGALFHRGILAVIGTQAPIPNISATYFAGQVYKELAEAGQLHIAVRNGRLTIDNCARATEIDWGIPVVFAHQPDLVICEPKKKIPKPVATAPADPAAHAAGQMLIPTLGPQAGPSGAHWACFGTGMDQKPAPAKATKKTEKSVVMVDIDTKAGYLPEMIKRANQAQSYFGFRAMDLPIPGRYVRRDYADGPQAFLPSLEETFRRGIKSSKADFICGITRYMIAEDKKSYNLMGCLLDNPRVIFVSTNELRGYAKKGKIDFAAALLRVCLAMIITSDEPKLDFHYETKGCLFDYDENRSDVVEMLKKNVFDHSPCRNKIKDKKLLEAIDAIMTIRKI